MNKELLTKIRTNPILYNYLREESYNYKYLYRDESYLNTTQKQAKEKYKLTGIDKIERLKNNLNLIKTFMDILE